MRHVRTLRTVTSRQARFMRTIIQKRAIRGAGLAHGKGKVLMRNPVLRALRAPSLPSCSSRVWRAHWRRVQRKATLRLARTECLHARRASIHIRFSMVLHGGSKVDAK